VTIGENGVTEKDILVHDKHNEILAYQLLEYSNPPHFPMAIGVLFEKAQSTYNDDYDKQIEEVVAKKGRKSLKEIIYSGETWKV